MEDLYKPAGVEKEMIHVHQVKVEPSWMDPIISFLKDDILLEEKLEAVKVCRKAHRFWLSEDQKLYKGSFSGPTYCADTLKQQNYCWKSYMRGSMGATPEVNLWHIGPSFKATGGQKCKRKHKNT